MQVGWTLVGLKLKSFYNMPIDLGGYCSLPPIVNATQILKLESDVYDVQMSKSILIFVAFCANLIYMKFRGTIEWVPYLCMSGARLQNVREMSLNKEGLWLYIFPFFSVY